MAFSQTRQIIIKTSLISFANEMVEVWDLFIYFYYFAIVPWTSKFQLEGRANVCICSAIN